MVELNDDAIKRVKGLTVFTMVVMVVGINYRRLVDAAVGLMYIVQSFILGAAIAFILNVPIRNIERYLAVFGQNSKLGRPVSLVVIILLVTGGLSLIIFVAVPQLAKTLINLQSNIPVFFARVCDKVEHLFASNPQILEYMSRMEVSWQEVFQNMIALSKSGAGTTLNTIFSAAVSIVSGVSSFLIGFTFVIYIPLRREALGWRIKKVLGAFLPGPAIGRILDITALTKRTFSRFLTGQCVEAVVLGIMFSAVLAVICLPYALLIGVLTALTALIPIFGVFTGLAVDVFLMLLTNPMDALIFMITFFVLQQMEGDPIYPYVVGNSMGLPSIWVLVVVTVGGSMMETVRMLIFIPLCFVLYTPLQDRVNARLGKKGGGTAVCEDACGSAGEKDGDWGQQK